MIYVGEKNPSLLQTGQKTRVGGIQRVAMGRRWEGRDTGQTPTLADFTRFGQLDCDCSWLSWVTQVLNLLPHG